VFAYCYFGRAADLQALCVKAREREVELRFMNQSYCEKEKEIIEALRCGTLSAELEKHASSCAICSDTVTVSEFLQSDRAAAPELPDSDFIWWMGQLASKRLAVERATRSIGAGQENQLFRYRRVDRVVNIGARAPGVNRECPFKA